MIIVVSLGTIITVLTYFFGFIFVVYIIEKIIYSINDLFARLNPNIPNIDNFSVQVFLLVLLGVIVILNTKGDDKPHKNENDETVYRKDWQKLLDIVNVAMIYPILNFYGKTNVINVIDEKINYI